VSLRPQDRFAANLRRARVASGVSQEELGRRCDLHRTEISLLERAGREPRLGTITKLASALGIEPAVLHEGIAWSPQRSAYVVEPPTAPAAPADRPKKMSGGGAGAGC
jgi:transcriptional regulator with XRE-family HTH domain